MKYLIAMIGVGNVFLGTFLFMLLYNGIICHIYGLPELDYWHCFILSFAIGQVLMFPHLNVHIKLDVLFKNDGLDTGKQKLETPLSKTVYIVIGICLYYLLTWLIF